jgi:hypothetical protein
MCQPICSIHQRQHLISHAVSFFLKRMGTFKEISGWYNADYVTPTSQVLALHRELLSRWTSFAKTGKPNNANYGGWLPVPSQGPNYYGTATEIGQQYFALGHKGIMWNITSTTNVIEHCAAFPRWDPFALVPTRSPAIGNRILTSRPTEYPTDFPTYSPTEYFPPSPTRTRRPTRRPTSRPTVRFPHGYIFFLFLFNTVNSTTKFCASVKADSANS